MSANSVTTSTQTGMSLTSAQPKTQSEGQKVQLKEKPIKLITFNIGKLSLALQIDQVYKVINLPTVHSSGINPVGLTQVDNQEITVLDLHRRLFHTKTELAPVNGYLVLVKTKRGELLGVPAIETPLLLDVPASLIRSLPESYRRSDTLEIASHIIVISESLEGSESSQRSLFLLDVERLTQ
jgi:chemotaxis signal transduction protein